MSLSDMTQTQKVQAIKEAVYGPLWMHRDIEEFEDHAYAKQQKGEWTAKDVQLHRKMRGGYLKAQYHLWRYDVAMDEEIQDYQDYINEKALSDSNKEEIYDGEEPPDTPIRMCEAPELTPAQVKMIHLIGERRNQEEKERKKK